MTKMADYYAWLDLETTGCERQHVMEVGIVVTDADWQAKGAFSEVVRPRVVPEEVMPERVLKMHEESGLLEEVHARGRIAWEVEQEALRFVDRVAGAGSRVGLAGSGVSHFDSRVLQDHMPALRRRLTYWTLDVGVLRRCLILAGFDVAAEQGGSTPMKSHRAVEDALLHLEEWKTYRGLLRRSLPRC